MMLLQFRFMFLVWCSYVVVLVENFSDGVGMQLKVELCLVVKQIRFVFEVICFVVDIGLQLGLFMKIMLCLVMGLVYLQMLCRLVVLVLVIVFSDFLRMVVSLFVLFLVEGLLFILVLLWVVCFFYQLMWVISFLLILGVLVWWVSRCLVLQILGVLDRIVVLLCVISRLMVCFSVGFVVMLEQLFELSYCSLIISFDIGMGLCVMVFVVVSIVVIWLMLC